MRLLTSPMSINFGDGDDTIFIPADTRVVVPAFVAQQIIPLLRDRQLHPRVSCLGSYTRHYGGQDLNGKRLIAWRGCGFGDQLIFAGLLAILKRRWPRADLHWAMLESVRAILWEGVPGLPFVTHPEPIPFAGTPADPDSWGWRDCDYHLMGLGMVEADQEPDQPDIWTAHLTLAGIDPATVPDSERRPLVPITDADQADAIAFAYAVAPEADGPLILWQLASSSPVRSYHPEPTRQALAGMRDAFPAATIVAIGTPDQVADYGPLPAGVVVANDLSLRALFALVRMADLLICPDSVFGHVAGAFNVPAISLWASFLPTDRVGSYTSHHPLVGTPGCAPCRKHETQAIQIGCPRAIMDPAAEPHSPYCSGLASIPPESIIHTAQELL